MPHRARLRRLVPVTALTVAVVLTGAASASAHARVSPAVSLAGEQQLYTLAVPTEKDGVTTTRIVMTVPSGFNIDSFAPPPPGWTAHVSRTGSGDSAVLTRVTWTGGHTPTGEDSVFSFLAQPSVSRTYTFGVQQTYSDGSIVSWSGPEKSEDPAPAITASATLGGGAVAGGGVSTLSIIALVVGVVGVLAAGLALADRGTGRRLA